MCVMCERLMNKNKEMDLNGIIFADNSLWVFAFQVFVNLAI